MSDAVIPSGDLNYGSETALPKGDLDLRSTGTPVITLSSNVRTETITNEQYESAGEFMESNGTEVTAYLMPEDGTNGYSGAANYANKPVVYFAGQDGYTLEVDASRQTAQFGPLEILDERPDVSTRPVEFGVHVAQNHGYLFVSGSAYGRVRKVDASSFTTVASYVHGVGYVCYKLASDGEYIYVTLTKTSESPKILKINPSDMSLAGTWQASGALSTSYPIYDLTVFNGYIYCCVQTASNTIYIVEINCSSMTTSRISSSSMIGIGSFSADNDGTYLYIQRYLSDYYSSSRIDKIDVSDFSSVANQTSPLSAHRDMCYGDGSIYFPEIRTTSPSYYNVYKFLTSPWGLDGSYDASACNSAWLYVTFGADGYLYVSSTSDYNPVFVLKIDVSDMSLVASYTDSSGGGRHLTTNNTHVFVETNYYYGLHKLLMTDMSLVSSWSFGDSTQVRGVIWLDI